MPEISDAAVAAFRDGQTACLLAHPAPRFYRDCCDRAGLTAAEPLIAEPLRAERDQARAELDTMRAVAGRLNTPMVTRLRRCAVALLSSAWGGAVVIYPPEARELIALIDAAASLGSGPRAPRAEQDEAGNSEACATGCDLHADPRKPVDEDADIRAQALAAASRLFAGAEVDGGTFRDLEQTALGAAERLAEWIATGRYDWMSPDPEPRAPGPQRIPDVDRIAQAIGDPGSIVGRRILPWRDGGDDGGQGETVTRWAARAVLAVLAETEQQHDAAHGRDRQEPAEPAVEPTHPDTHGKARSAAHGPHSGRTEAQEAIADIRAALTNAADTCRYHGATFTTPGLGSSEPRCESCRQPWRIVRARAALDTIGADR